MIFVMSSLVVTLAALLALTSKSIVPPHTYALPTTLSPPTTIGSTPGSKRSGQPGPETGAIPKRSRTFPTEQTPEAILPDIDSTAGPSGGQHLFLSRQDQM